MSPIPRRSLFALAAVVALGACKGAECVSGPLCGDDPIDPPPTSTLTSIVVTSPVDSVMAAGRNATFTAEAFDQSGGAMTATFTWASSNGSTAGVNSGGVVSALAAGTTTISATSSTVTGDLAIRVVPSDLDGLTATLTEPFFLALSGALASATTSQLQGAVTACTLAVTAGHVLNIRQCLIDAAGVGGSDGNDDALLGILALFIQQAERQLAYEG